MWERYEPEEGDLKDTTKEEEAAHWRFEVWEYRSLAGSEESLLGCAQVLSKVGRKESQISAQIHLISQGFLAFQVLLEISFLLFSSWECV